jgi:2-oxoglutarate ferredoxin oxidoreductase subunit delta
VKGGEYMVTSTQRKSSYVVIDTERCKGCQFCIAFCPKGILKLASRINRMGYTPAELNEETSKECSGCAICALMCPDVAITVHRLKKV